MIAVLGAGAFGSALAIALSSAERDVLLWGRDVSGLDGGAPKLPGVASPDRLRVTDDLAEVAPAGIVLLALPTQAMAAFLRKNSDVLQGKTLIACCKGIDLASGSGPTAVIQTNVPKAHAAVLSGPSFAADIARGLPTALTLAADWDLCDVQEQLSTPVLRLYRSSDPIGVEVGGALKNVVAIACGGAIGAGLGRARAALMTRGLSEIQRLGAGFGARPETLTGLSGLGDLALTCTSEHSRNYRHGLALGRGQGVDETATVEGVATADAVCAIADARGFDMPICREVAALCAGNRAVTDAMEALLARPLKERSEALKYWLFKSEPSTWSWDDQVATGEVGEEWDGVRNYQARNNMRLMSLGDRGFFYHSQAEKAVVGIVEVSAESHPDSTTDDARWDCVDIKAIAPVGQPVTLEM